MAHNTPSSARLCAALLALVPVTAAAQQHEYAARSERVPDFGVLVPRTTIDKREHDVRLERVTAGVPWPRGLAWVDDELVVLARGRHRRSGGVAPGVVDYSGTLMLVDPNVSEPVVPGQVASPKVCENARVLASPTASPFFLYDERSDTLTDIRMDRPYCTLGFDAASRNLFICGFSGVDLPGGKFRKNATDSIHRFDLRTNEWRAVEMHDHRVVPTDELGVVVSNEYYPHHDPSRNAAPHGWLNGPDGAAIVGRYLYAVGKDNHVVVRYDLDPIRANPEAPPPESHPVLTAAVRLRHPHGEGEVALFGPSAADAFGGYLYVAYRTSSVVARFPVDPDGALIEPVVGELIAVFEPWDTERGRSANVIDLAFNSRGQLFVSCAKEARIWKVGVPDPTQPFYGNDQTERPTTTTPYVDMKEMTGVRKGVGNILFDPQDRLYICAGNYDAGNDIAGAVYRAVPRGNHR